MKKQAAAADVKFDVLINRRSGTVLRTGEDKVKQGLAAAFGSRTGDITFIDGGDIAAAVRSWAAKNAGSNRTLVIGGGDGTVLTAANEVMGRTDITLGVLPLGTHNLFARQLGFSADFNQAAAQYKSSAPETIDVGQVNGMNFLCGLMLDQNMVQFLESHEDRRNGKHLSALQKVISFGQGLTLSRPRKLKVSAGAGAPETTYSGRVFLVSNNLLAPKKGGGILTPGRVKTLIENMWNKGDMADGQLAFYAIPAGPLAVGMLGQMKDGSWADKVASFMSPQLRITTDDKEKETAIVLDGEVKKTQYPLNVKILPRALRVYRPQ
jgi:diacylglycerol kinase family enzyme